jgi:hypothetical protein
MLRSVDVSTEECNRNSQVCSINETLRRLKYIFHFVPHRRRSVLDWAGRARSFGAIPVWGKRVISSPKRPDWRWGGLPSLLTGGNQGAVLPVGKAGAAKTDHRLWCSAEVKNE